MQWTKLGISLLIVIVAASLGNIATTSSVDGWYEALNKPDLTPPGWLFGPVWTILYGLIGLALYLVWVARPQASKRTAYWIFTAQLSLNTAWSMVFFGLQQPWIGVVVIILLLLAILANIALFWSHSRVAALMLLPYALWVTYAMALNFGIATLN